MILASSGTDPGFLNLQVQWWEWLALIGVTVAAIAIDMLANRGHQTPTFKKAASLVAFFVVIGALYGLFVIFMHGGQAGALYYSAWGIEYSLSIDNVFIWVVILDTFKVPSKYRHKLLFLGVFGALVFRFVFIFAGSILINQFGAFVIPILAVVVALSAWNVWKDDTEDEIEDTLAYKAANKVLPIKHGTNYGGQFFVVEKLKAASGKVKTKVWVTYLFVAVVVIELVDIMFAFDSVPAALAITTVTYLVFSSNAMAILGLRALFFVIGPLKEKMSWLNEGLAVILGWVALKLLLAWEFSIGNFHHEAIWHPPVWLSLAIIGVVLTISVVASLYWPKKEGATAASDELRRFNAALVLHGGASYQGELDSGLLQRVYTDTLRALGDYDTDGIVPVFVAGEEPELVATERLDAEPVPVRDLLSGGLHGEVHLAAAIREVLALLPANEPALITVISDFQLADASALTALIDHLALSSDRSVFFKLVFATGDEDGDYALPQVLDDRHSGVHDIVDAVYATHFHGEPGESVQEHFGRELDVYARQLARQSPGNSPDSVPVS